LSARAADIHVPDTIQGVIAARMDRLEEELKRTMQVASVIGRDFAYRILHTITGTGEELKSHLVNLQGLEFIYEKSLFPELEYIFKHALTQEVAYESLLVKRRKEIHEKIGRAIEELYPDRLEEFCEVLAHHYSRSENTEKAYQYLELSGNKATRNYAKWEALRHYRDAIDILGTWPETEENKRKGIDIRLLMTTPMRYMAYPEGSLQVIEEGVKLAKEVGGERSLALFYSLLSVYYSFKGEPFRGIEYAEHCFEEAEKVQDLDLMAAIGLQLCVTYTGAQENLRIAGVAPKVLGLLEETGRESEPFGWGLSVYAALCSIYGLAAAMLGDLQKGEALCEKGLRFALEIDDLYAIGFAEVMYGGLCAQKGEGEKTVELSQNAIRHIEETQFLTIMGAAWHNLGMGHLLLGQPEAALEHIEKGLEISRSVGFSPTLSGVCRQLAEVHRHLGNLEEARSRAEEALKVALNNNETTYAASARVLLGAILGRSDPSKSGEAEEHILQGIETLDERKERFYSARGRQLLGELYADTGQKEKALEALNKAEAEFKDMGMDYWLKKAQEVLARVEG
jgi:tetratricopeptide (TPR) repeat protein